MINVGVCFSKPLEDIDPLSHIGPKYPVYIRLLELMKQKGWRVWILTRKTYLKAGVFEGGWEYLGDAKFKVVNSQIKVDLVYDRSGGVNFPPDEKSLKVVNNRKFKVMCWDKWLGYQEIGEYMPKTHWVGEIANLGQVIPEIKTDFVVVKPHNGLKGLGIYIGPKKGALSFDYSEKYKQYIAQEFVDTSGGLLPITNGPHDVRIVVINQKVVWSHVRVPPKGSYKANAAGGGVLREIDYEKEVPDSIKKVVEAVSDEFYKKYDNPIYSLDFGMDKSGVPYIFEINDQIGFPKPGMKNGEFFLKELVANFESKINI